VSISLRHCSASRAPQRGGLRAVRTCRYTDGESAIFGEAASRRLSESGEGNANNSGENRCRRGPTFPESDRLVISIGLPFLIWIRPLCEGPKRDGNRRQLGASSETTSGLRIAALRVACRAHLPSTRHHLRFLGRLAVTSGAAETSPTEKALGHPPCLPMTSSISPMTRIVLCRATTMR
jgi:hypothetical protein